MSVHFKTFPHTGAIDRNIWNRLAAGASPMMEWEYFHSLEESGSVSGERGYKPCHLMMYEGMEPVGLAPLYERDRSWVEFGDGGLIEILSEITGYPFYEGLVGTIPFTPVPGYELLHLPGRDPFALSKALLDYIDYMCETNGLSSSRVYFVSFAAPHLHHLLHQQGYICLKSQYCLWLNRDYRSFDDFLGALKSSRRRKIRHELRSIREMGIDIRMIPASEASESCYDDIFNLYQATWTKYMGHDIRPFLNQKFFRLLSDDFRHRNSFCIASRSGETIAMALFYEKGRNLYGRYWGCFEEIPFLHFATCYYHPIQYAIEHGMGMMDPGFGGEHKLYRGYETVPAYHYVKFYGEQQRRIAHAVLEKMRTQSIARSVRT